KRRRARKLLALLQKQSQERTNRFIGSTVEVLVEGPSEETELLLAGRMSTQAQEIDGHVLINDLGGFDDLKPGDLVDVEITEALPHDVIGRVTGVRSRAAGLVTEVAAPVKEWRTHA